jgi:glycosyltransferase involved in cell wall biosynthesis
LTQPEVSVIIPVYNVEKYLRQCLDSVVNQTLWDIEVVCVDDGSTDNSSAILAEYAVRDTRITVLAQEHTGVSRARNRGIATASGKYVSFIDADDYININTLERLVKIADKNEADIVVFGGVTFPAIDDWANRCLSPRNVAYRSKFIRALFKENGSRPFIHNKIFNRYFLESNHLLFSEELALGEDQVFQFFAFPRAHQITYISDKLYHYRQDNENSAMVRFNSDHQKKLDQHIKIINIIYEKWIRTGDMKGNENDWLNWSVDMVFPYWSIAGYNQKKNVAGNFTSIVKKLSHVAKPTRTNKVKIEEMTGFATDSHSIKVSVIVPVYNAERYLRQCLASVANQSLSDIEIICVDDGSPDSSYKIMEEFAQADSRFVLLQQKNQYAGVARNNGMKLARGEYLCFLDADDFCESSMLEETYNAARKDDADICLFEVKYYNTETKIKVNAPWILRKDFLPSKRPFSRLDIPDKILNISIGCAWGKLYRRAFVEKEGLQFQPLRNNNDVYFVETSLVKAGRITTVERPLLYYRTAVKDSLQATRGGVSENSTHFFRALSAVKKEAENKGIYREIRRSFVNKALSDCLHNLNDSQDEASFKYIYEKLRTQIFEELDLLDIDESYLHKNYSASLFRQYENIRKYTVTEYLYIENQSSRWQLQNSNKICSNNARNNEDSTREISSGTLWFTDRLNRCWCCYQERGLKYTLYRVKEHLLGR